MILLQITRFVLTASLILMFISVNLLLYILFFTNKPIFKKTGATSCRFFTKSILYVLNIKPSCKGVLPLEPGYLIVSNHLSYLDILVLNNYLNCSYVTSVEIKNTPFLGQLAVLSGALFVERRSRQNLKSEIKEITEALENKINVCIFPEGTSTNGSEVKAFKRSLLESALSSNSDILPVVINYTESSDEGINTLNRDNLFWYSDMEFLPHLWNLCGIKKSKAEISIMSKLNCSNYTETSTLRDDLYNLISKHYIKIV